MPISLLNTVSTLLQVERKKFEYKWDLENKKYGPLAFQMDRASDADDSDFENRDQELKARALGSGRRTLRAIVGRKWLIAQRNLAKYEARRHPCWSEEKFEKEYPEFDFEWTDSDDYPDSVLNEVFLY